MLNFIKILIAFILSNVYTRILFLFIIPVSILILLFLSIDTQKGSLLYSIKNVFLTVIYPVQKAGSGIYTFFEDKSKLIKDKSKLIEENKILKQELDFLRFKIIELKNKEVENEKLKELLNFVKRDKDLLKNAIYITGKVIGVSYDNSFDFVIVNVGKEDLVKEGNLVLSNGYVAGILNQVSKYSSSVMLVTNRDFKITVRLRNTREIAFFQGHNREYGILKYVRPEQDIRVGDIVETAGFGKFPSGIPIGIVDKVIYDEGDFFKTVKVRLFLKPSKLEYVLIIKPEKNES